MPTVLITGSSRGIGKAIAGALRARGAVVIGHSSRPSEDADTIAADFAEPPAPQMLWQEALERANGAIDVLVNNAGLFAAAPIDMSDIAWLDAWEETMRINLTATAQLSRFAVRHWLGTGQLSPHKWEGFAAAGLVALAAAMLQLGVVGDMLNRHRVYLEELLYRQRSGAGRGAERE